MKIILKRDDQPFRVYHHPRDVVVRPKAAQVEIINLDGTLLEKYQLIKKDLGWLEDDENDTSEIILTLTIGKYLS
jgi:hypothetical protein